MGIAYPEDIQKEWDMIGLENQRGVKLLKNRTSSLILALAVMFFWGSLFPMIKIGYRVFDVDTSSPASILLFAGIRFVICGIVLILLFSRDRGKPAFPEGNVLKPILIIAMTAYVMHYTCTYIGLSRLEPSKTAILKQIGTLFIICFSFLFRREDRFTPAKMIGGILGFLSIIVVNMEGLRLTFSVYDLLIICASFCSVVSVIVSKNAYDRYSPMMITAWAQFAGGVVLTGLGLALGGRLGKINWQSVLALGYICFASCAGYCLWNMLLKYNDMSRLNLIKFAETLFAAVCSWILLGEHILRWEYLASFVLVCLGIMIGNGMLKPHKGKEQ